MNYRGLSDNSTRRYNGNYQHACKERNSLVVRPLDVLIELTSSVSRIAMSRALLPDCKAQHVLQKMVVRTQRSWRCWSSMTSEESVDSLPYLSCAVERQRHIHKLRKRGIAEPF